ncbi:MAG: response regulator [Filimonas sp.]|nr:response regulator [Filimonas sp.]
MDNVVKILVVDDDPFALQAGKEMFKFAKQRKMTAGMPENLIVEVDCSSDAASALSEFDILKYDIVYTDYLMPYMRGDEFIIQLKARGYHGQAIIMSSATGPDISYHLHQLFDLYDDLRLIHKPLGFELFLSNIKRVLDGRGYGLLNE